MEGDVVVAGSLGRSAVCARVVSYIDALMLVGNEVRVCVGNVLGGRIWPLVRVGKGSDPKVGDGERTGVCTTLWRVDGA